MKKYLFLLLALSYSAYAALSVPGGIQGPPGSPAPGTVDDDGIVLFDGTTGAALKQATGTGVVKSTNGVFSVGDVDLASEVTGLLPPLNIDPTDDYVVNTIAVGGTGGPFVGEISADPSTGGGFTAPIGSILLRDNTGAGEVYVKFGAGDTQWTNILTGVSGWGLTGNSGTTPGTNFIGTTDSQALVFKTDGTERFRISATGALDTTLSTGLVHSDSSGVLTSSLLVNSDVDAAAAIAGTKISPNFGSQTVVANGVQATGSGGLLFEASSGTDVATFGAGGGSQAVFNGALESLTSFMIQDPGAGTNAVTLVAPTGLAANYTVTLPTAQPAANNYLLQSSTSGAWSWVDPATLSPSTTLQDAYNNGVNGQILFDNTRGGLHLLDSSGNISSDLFRVTNDTNTSAYFRVTPGGMLTTNAYVTNLTSGRVALVGASSQLVDDANLTYSSGLFSNSNATTASYRWVKSGLGAGQFQIDYLGTTDGVWINSTAHSNPIYFYQNGDIGLQFQTDRDLRFYRGALFQETGGGSDTVKVVAPSSVTTSHTITLPAATNTIVGQVLGASNTSGSLEWQSPRTVQTFTGTTITATSAFNQSWRYLGTSAQGLTSISTAGVPDGARLTIIATDNTDTLTVFSATTGIAAMNGDYIMGLGASITFEYVVDIGGWVEVSRNDL